MFDMCGPCRTIRPWTILRVGKVLACLHIQYIHYMHYVHYYITHTTYATYTTCVTFVTWSRRNIGRERLAAGGPMQPFAVSALNAERVERIYIYIYVYVYVCVYIYIYIHNDNSNNNHNDNDNNDNDNKVVRHGLVPGPRPSLFRASGCVFLYYATYYRLD